MHSSECDSSFEVQPKYYNLPLRMVELSYTLHFRILQAVLQLRGSGRLLWGTTVKSRLNELAWTRTVYKRPNF